MQTSPAEWSPALRPVMEQGAYLIVSRFDRQVDVLQKTHQLIHEGVETLCGRSAAEALRRRGFGALHEVISAEQIGPLRDYVMPRLRPDLLQLTCRIGRHLLGIDGEFFVDDYTILRINFPYETARLAPRNAENPGIGRVDDKARQAATARVVDPVYDPKGYHNHEPPAAWAHGPHQDTWTGHSRFGVNLWWAVDDVPEECSMVFYPEMFGRFLESDPRNLYLQSGFPLPRPTKMSLRRGEMLIFNPELLHGTHLNTTRVTRLALSTRINPRQPKFSPHCFYAREFWHSSKQIEAGRFDQVLRFRREDHLEHDAPALQDQAPPPRRELRLPLEEDAAAEWFDLCDSRRIAAGEKLLVQLPDGGEVLLLRGDRELKAVQSRCPHLNVSLQDGFHDDQTLYCPAHAVAYSTDTGRSSCAALSLRTFTVREQDGRVWLKRPLAMRSACQAA